MAALPVKKLTRARQGRRMVRYKLKPVYSSRCPQCQGARLSHTACGKCGYYKGRKVVGRVEE